MKFSIILPIYNININLIKECIDSIKLQDYDNWECILIDDGSNEKYNYVDYYNDLVTNDKRFKYYYKKNEGLAITRNYGFNKCSGDLVWFIDSDDYIKERNSLSIISDIFNKNNDIDFVEFRYSELINKQIIDPDIFKKSVKVENKLCNLSFDLFNQWNTVWRYVFKKQFLIQNNILHLNKNILMEDTFFLLLCKTLSKNYFLLEHSLYVYRKSRIGSILNSNKKITKLISHSLINIDECYTYLKKQNILSDLFYFYLLFYGEHLIFSKNKNLRKNLLMFYKENSHCFNKIKKYMILVNRFWLSRRIFQAYYLIKHKWKKIKGSLLY